MPAKIQTDLVAEIAAIVTEYRRDASNLVKFGLKCAIALNREPIAGGIMYAPKRSDETFKIRDTSFEGKFETDKDAFFAAFDRFTGHAAFLAWDGRLPDPAFEVVKQLSDNYAFPTMMVELVFRRRGSDLEKKLSMFFIGFPDEESAVSYGKRREAALVSTRPFRGKFYDWY